MWKWGQSTHLVKVPMHFFSTQADLDNQDAFGWFQGVHSFTVLQTVLFSDQSNLYMVTI